ncbi:MAG TPA: hypothetical protein VGB13_04645 [Candidatus Krumholzibacteria bacterium]
MRLRKVTISGADADTPAGALDALEERYPFVEWAILVSPKRAGGPRYPAPDALAGLVDGRAACHCAFHLCGTAARQTLGGDGFARPPPGLRIQLNGFTQWVDEHGPLTPVGQWMTAVRAAGVEVILQVQHERALSVARLLADIHPNVSALWDQSGGRGRLTAWPDPLPGLRMGYAGGITPDNVKHALEDLAARTTDGETWIDMESGVRTDDKLDLAKVESVLAQAEPYVHHGEAVQ